jgi:acetyltransferase
MTISTARPARAPDSPAVQGFSRYGARSIPPLDGLRAVAAVSVLVFHVWNRTAPNWAAGAPPPVRWGVANLGQNGVSCFFVLSAFLLGTPFLERALGVGGAVDMGRYWRARILRLYPAWLVVLAAVAIAWRPWVLGDPLAMLQYAALQQNYNPRLAQHVIPQGWTLGVEISFYALLPALLGAATFTLRSARYAVRAAVVWGGVIVLLGLSYASQSYLTDHRSLLGVERRNLMHSAAIYGDRFCLGLICALAFVEMRRRRVFFPWPLWLAGATLIFTLGVSFDPTHRKQYAAAACAGVLMTLVVGERSAVGRLFAAPAMRTLGRLSYGIYLWHLPLLGIGAAAGLFPERTPLATAPCIVGLAAVSVTLAHLSYRYVERPALRLVDRAAGVRPRRHPAAAYRPAESPESVGA